MGWGRQARNARRDSWLSSLRCGWATGPTEVGLARFLTVWSPWLSGKGRAGVTQSPERRLGGSASWHPCAPAVGPEWDTNGSAVPESASLEVVAALEESCEQSPDSAPVLLPLVALASEKSGTSEPLNCSLP